MIPQIKICGIADPAIASEAAALGADFIGVIFVPRSPRCIDIARACLIASAARCASGGKPPRVAGVFAGQTADFILSAVQAVPLDIVQLHGGCAEDAACVLKRAGVEVWAADCECAGNVAAADAVLLDGRDGARTGGTGIAADWRLVGEYKARGRKVVLAGGLGERNIAEAAATGAEVLDVNSSLETAPGVKDPVLLRRLFAVFRAGLQEKQRRGSGGRAV